MKIKRIILLFSFLFLCNFCFSEITSIRVELSPKGNEQKTINIYDSEEDNSNYPFLIFRDSLTGWGKKNGYQKYNPLFVPKNTQPEGTYIVYVITDENTLPRKFRVLNFKVMQDVQSGIYYKTDFLQYLYEYIVKKYLQTL